MLSALLADRWKCALLISSLTVKSRIGVFCLYVCRSSVELSSDEDGSVSMMKSSEMMNTAQCISQMYRKSLRLTSEQIVRAHLTMSSSFNQYRTFAWWSLVRSNWTFYNLEINWNIAPQNQKKGISNAILHADNTIDIYFHDCITVISL